MKIGYSQADVAKAYYDKVKPGNGYNNRKANNQFCQDSKIKWNIVGKIVDNLNRESLSAISIRHISERLR